MDTRFEKAFQMLFEMEGKKSNHPADPGGLTVYGISKVYHPEMFVNGLPSREDAVEFYEREFWKPQQLDKFNDFDLAFEVFEASVNCGLRNGGFFLQRAYNMLATAWNITQKRKGSSRRLDLLLEDGVIGPKTLAAVKQFCRQSPQYAKALRNAANKKQGDYYEAVATPEFLIGWYAVRM